MVHRIVAGTAAVVLALGLAGCSSDSGSTPSTTISKQAVCADRDSLERSVRELTDLDLSSADKASIQGDLNQVEDNLGALGSSVKADLKPQVDGLKSALQDLQDAVKSFGDQSIGDSLQQTGTAISKVGSAGVDLATALDTQCSG